MSEIYDTPILLAVGNGNAELLEFLIEHGANPNYISELDETIFDNWPTGAEAELEEVMKKHSLTRRGENASE